MAKLEQWVCDRCHDRTRPDPEGAEKPEGWIEFSFAFGWDKGITKLLCPLCATEIHQACAFTKQEVAHVTT